MKFVLKELLKKRKRLHELEAQYYVGQIITGVKYVHTQNVIHRDLKLGNLFLGKNLELKIGDFGLAAKLDFTGEKRRTVCGTPNYIAPEVLNSKICGHSFEADIWSIGVILYAMLVGKPPFETNNVKHTYKRIRANDYSFPSNLILSAEAKSLINSILSVNPARRPTLDAIMKHPFMTKNSIPKHLPLSSLNSPPNADFLSQYIGTVDKSELSKTRTTTASMRRPGLLDTFRQFSSQKGLPRVTTAALKGRVFVKTTNFTKQSKPSIKPLKSTNEVKPLHSVLSSPGSFRGTITSATTVSRPMEYVTYYQDYTDRYGIGYMMTNGVIGFYYNDMTNFLWLEAKNQYGYSDYYNKREKAGVVYMTKHNSVYDTRDINKKIRILEHFKGHCKKLEGSLVKVQSTVQEVAIKRVIKTKGGILLRLTNSVVQMIFLDTSQIIFSFKTKKLIYINKHGVEETTGLSTEVIGLANEKIIKQSKYTLNVLNYMNAGNGNHAVHTERDRQEEL
jgi:polo-like kinase 1